MSTLIKLCGLVMALGLLWSNASAQNDADQFFAGTVVESTAEQLTVARVVLGKNESRIFRITVETKFEGRVVLKGRVTVRFVTEDDGDRATLVIVRNEPPGKTGK